MIRSQKQNIELFLVSFIMLFLELTIIRWISTEIRIFSYFNNLVLLACFLGIGFGCFYSNKKANLSITLLLVAILFVVVNMPFIITTGDAKIHLFRDIPLLLSAFTDSIIWYESGFKATFLNILLGMVSTLILFFVILFIFMPLGQILGRLLDAHKNIIKAYSINIIASILGVWCFSSLSFLYSPPWFWFILFCGVILILVLFRARTLMTDLLSILMCFLLIISTISQQSETEKTLTIWSPYQKLDISPIVDRESNINRGYMLTVNNVGYMGLLNLSENFIKDYPDYFQYDMRKFGQYDMPFLFKPEAKDVLLLGAGAGNDAAGALRNGAENIDVVEIDPGIYELGLKFHPEKPYLDSRVNIIIDDARSFLKKTRKKYDIISFGLLDAHTLSSSYNNMRLDHYVYTEESFQEAKNLLKEDGLLTVIFEPARVWIGQRIYELLKKVFDSPSIAFNVRSRSRFGFGGVMFVTGNDINKIKNDLNNNSRLNQFISNNIIDFSENKPVKLTNDNWPYLYLEKPSIPKMHLSIIIILLLLFVATKKLLVPKGERLNLHFFFLGAAFLLLEFQNISKTTLIFGSTWLVNSFTISAILILILLANLFVSHFKIGNVKTFYCLLLLSIIVIYLVPLRTFNFLGYWPKSILVSIFLNLPIFFAGIIFIYSLKNTKYKDIAFGSNLLGSATGGILECLSFITGINILLLIVMVFYSLSFIFMKQKI